VERNLVAADPKKRAESVQYTKDCITMVKELDGFEMTIVPATVGKIVPDATPDEEWKWAVESMKEIYEHSEKAGVRLAIEPLKSFRNLLPKSRRASNGSSRSYRSKLRSLP
jgi:sugar phosphate isomerase/epimerase